MFELNQGLPHDILVEAQKKVKDPIIYTGLVKRRDSISRTNTKVTLSLIIKSVCEFFNISEDEVMKKCRKREIITPRQIIHYLATKYRVGILDTIGELVGNKDHATVLYSCKTVSDLMDVDKNYEADIETIINNINRYAEEMHHTGL